MPCGSFCRLPENIILDWSGQTVLQNDGANLEKRFHSEMFTSYHIISHHISVSILSILCSDSNSIVNN